MTVIQSTATVFFGGRRRWFSLAAACRAEAKLRFKADDENDERFEVRVPQLAAEARAEFERSAGAAPVTPESRALAAVRELVTRTADVKRLSTLIGDSIAGCVIAWQEKHCDKDGNHRNPSGEQHESHLKAAYEFDEDDDGDRAYLTPAEQIEILAVCPHCLAAHHAIQERKAARRKLGAARRAVTMIGREK